MNKKFSILLVFTLVVAFVFAGCKNSAYYPDPYTAYNGIDLKAVVELDEYVNLDGELTEDIWTKSKNSIQIAGIKTDQVTESPVDTNVFGERSATVYSYIGEKAVYFAFDVKDKNLYFNANRANGQNTGIELYFAQTNQSGFTKGCYSVRISPIGKNNEINVTIYEPKYFDGVISKNDPYNANTWELKVNTRGLVNAKASVNGVIMNNIDQIDYSTENNVGYVLEIAIDKSLFGGENIDSFIYTAAFCQARNFTENRLGNSFISGTSYINPLTWLITTNEGYTRNNI